MQAKDMLSALKKTAPECILIDAQAERAATLDLLEKVKQKLPNTPVLVIEKDGELPDAVEVLRAGAVDYIQQPIVDRILLECVQNAIASSS
jgi:FixJ family two-component response regulator